MTLHYIVLIIIIQISTKGRNTTQDVKYYNKNSYLWEQHYDEKGKKSFGEILFQAIDSIA